MLEYRGTVRGIYCLGGHVKRESVRETGKANNRTGDAFQSGKSNCLNTGCSITSYIFFSMSAFVWCYEMIISYWSVCPSVCSSICRPFVYPSDFLPVRPSTRLSVFRSFRLPACPFLCLSNPSFVFLPFVSLFPVRPSPCCLSFIRTCSGLYLNASSYVLG